MVFAVVLVISRVALTVLLGFAVVLVISRIALNVLLGLVVFRCCFSNIQGCINYSACVASLVSRKVCFCCCYFSNIKGHVGFF